MIILCKQETYIDFFQKFCTLFRWNCNVYTECLKDTIARAWPYFEDQIRPQMLAGKRVLIAAHGNSLRALVMKLEHLTPDEILKVNIPTGVPLVYTFDAGFNVLDKRYIGDPATIAAKIDAVANQGKAKK